MIIKSLNDIWGSMDKPFIAFLALLTIALVGCGDDRNVKPDKCVTNIQCSEKSLNCKRQFDAVVSDFNTYADNVNGLIICNKITSLEMAERLKRKFEEKLTNLSDAAVALRDSGYPIKEIEDVMSKETDNVRKCYELSNVIVHFENLKQDTHQ